MTRQEAFEVLRKSNLKLFSVSRKSSSFPGGTIAESRGTMCMLYAADMDAGEFRVTVEAEGSQGDQGETLAAAIETLSQD